MQWGCRGGGTVELAPLRRTRLALCDQKHGPQPQHQNESTAQKPSLLPDHTRLYICNMLNDKEHVSI